MKMKDFYLTLLSDNSLNMFADNKQSEFTVRLVKKDPVHERIMRTTKRLREEEDYDDDESMQYAIKKQKFLIERKLDEYDPSSYVEDEEQAQTQSLPYKAPMNTLPYKPSTVQKCNENCY